MSLAATDGFDMYNGVAVPTATAPSLQTKWGMPGSGGISLVAGRFGGQALRIAGSGQVTRPMTAARTAAAFGLAMRWNSLRTNTNATPFFNLWTGSTYQWGMVANIGGGIDVYRGNAATLLGSTAPGILTASAYNYLEIETAISTTVGSINLYLNGASILSLSGINNAAAGAGTSVNTIVLGSANGNWSGSVDIDDLYEADTNTKIGEGWVETLRANADGTITWTPDSGANNFGRVNETLVDGDTSYVQTGTLNNQDLYDLANLSSSPVSIYGVQLVDFALKTDATTRAIALVAKSGGTTNVGGNFNLSASYQRLERMLTQDPNTAAAWLAAGVNALQSGPKVTV